MSGATSESTLSARPLRPMQRMAGVLAYACGTAHVGWIKSGWKRLDSGSRDHAFGVMRLAMVDRRPDLLVRGRTCGYCLLIADQGWLAAFYRLPTVTRPDTFHWLRYDRNVQLEIRVTGARSECQSNQRYLLLATI